MANKKYVVRLTPEQEKILVKLVASGRTSARVITRARILLKTDSARGKQPWTDEAISKALDVSTATIQRVRQLFVERGMDFAIGYSRPKRSYKYKINEEAKALLVVFYFMDPPNGRRRWTARLLANKLTKWKYVDKISDETVRITLRERGLNICR